MGVRLPPEYQETEWIEGTRNLYLIDTGILGNKNTLVIEAKVKPGKYVQYAALWGNYRGENYNVTRLIAYNTNSILSYINTKAGGGTNAVVIPPLFGTGKTFVIRQERTRLIIDGTAYTIPAIATASENSGNIAINASSTGNPSSGNSGIQRWYYFRIFDGEIILRDFIPCYRKSDMIAGMYDLVSNAFFANARTDKTSEFTAGPDVIDSISPWLVARRRLLMKKKTARLPAEYQEVEYLETSQTGAPYINSGVAITEDLVFEIDFQLTNSARARYFMGKYNGDDFYLYLSGDSTPYFQTAFGSTWANTSLLVDTQWHKFIYQFENGNLVVKDSDTTILTKAKGIFSERPILVAGTSQGTRTPCRTYESKMTKSGVVIQDLIPCYRKADDTPGMYDLVSNTFFTNAGTGEFIVGADIN